MIQNKKLYGYIEEKGSKHYWYAIMSIYIAEPNKSFIKVVTYQKGTYQRKNIRWTHKHALDSLSRGAFETRMRRAKTYNIGLLSEQEYEEIMTDLIPEIL